MSLLDERMEACLPLEQTYTDDGYGSSTAARELGEGFYAALVLDSSIEARRAEKEGVKDLYTVITTKDTTLMAGDVFQRVSTGDYFRVTSDGADKHTPASAGLDMRAVSAEMLESLPE